MSPEDADGNVADAPIVVADDGAERTHHCRIQVVGSFVHANVHPNPAATRHRHRGRHGTRHWHAGIGEAPPPPPPPEPAVIGQRFAGERANSGVTGSELTKDPRDACGIEGRAVLGDDEQDGEQRCNHGNPG